MNIVPRDGQWWIESEHLDAPCGPYKTRKAADEDRRGLARFFRDNPKYRASSAPVPKPAEVEVTEPTFALARSANKPARVVDPELSAPITTVTAAKTVQKPLFCGLHCLPGQLDLFQTDGDSTSVR